MITKKYTYQKSGDCSHIEFWAMIPNLCPRCHYSIEPREVVHEYCESNNSFFIIFFCPFCKNPFIAQYFDVNTHNIKSLTANCELFPKEYNKKEFDDIIESRFPNFCKIYNQALQAEAYGLDELAGMGLRKAVEYLIKDYCILKKPDKSENIKKMLLGQVIEKYIDDIKIKSNAQVANWLANDETHYIKIYKDKDINDIKVFIKAIVAYITYDLITDEANEIILEKEKIKSS